MPVRPTFAAALLAAALAAPSATAETAVDMVYLERRVERPPTLSNLDPIPGDLGLAGARVALADNATTGQFLGHAYALEEIVVEPEEDWLDAARGALGRAALIVANAPAEDLLALADLPEAEGALILNAAAEEVALRDADCRRNVLHTIASHDMRADAIMQFLVWKRWTATALISGDKPQDRAFAEALRRSAGKFGVRIAAEKDWVFDVDMRRSAAGETPLFTQDLGQHDVLLVSDEIGDFAQYILYNTWLPRPVAGSEGMSPQTWSGALEQWGAVQLQNRFRAAAGRDMRSIDHGAWLAVRAIGEAVTRTGSADPQTIRAYLLSDAFALDGFKGAALSFRDWNGQMRMPVPLVHPRALVTLTPIEGFLHERNPLDTLGIDAPESVCTAFD